MLGLAGGRCSAGAARRGSGGEGAEVSTRTSSCRVSTETCVDVEVGADSCWPAGGRGVRRATSGGRSRRRGGVAAVGRGSVRGAVAGRGLAAAGDRCADGGAEIVWISTSGGEGAGAALMNWPAGKHAVRTARDRRSMCLSRTRTIPRHGC